MQILRLEEGVVPSEASTTTNPALPVGGSEGSGGMSEEATVSTSAKTQDSAKDAIANTATVAREGSKVSSDRLHVL